MIDYIVAIIIGVVSSIGASFIVIHYLSRRTPKIVISPKISRWKDINKKRIYQIKVINEGRRPIMNIKAQLSLVVPRKAPGGETIATEEITLYNSKVMELSKFDMKDEEHNYAFRFGTYKNIEDKILSAKSNCGTASNEQPFFRFKIYGTDSFSGFGKVFVQKYPERDSIVKGDFQVGESFEIKIHWKSSDK